MRPAAFPWSSYPLPPGTPTPDGPIERVTPTGYLIGGDWYDHTAVHGPRPWADALAVIL